MLTLRKLENRIVLDGAVAAAVLGHDSDHDSDSVEAHQTDSDQAAPEHNDAFPDVAALIADDADGGQGVDVVLISDNAPDYQTLVDAVDPQARVIVYDADSESLADVIESVRAVSKETGQQIHSLSILSHGENGNFKIGNETITSDNIGQYSESWEALDSAMSDDGHIYVFGCSLVNESGEGQSLIDQLAGATNTRVYGSDDITGAGGDWVLEVQSQSNEEVTPIPPLNFDKLSAQYKGVLAPPEFPGPPSVNLPLSFSVNEDNNSGVTFTVKDDNTDSKDLNVWAESSDKTILPDENITCIWVEGNIWRMDVEPAANYSTSSDITITVHAQDSEGVSQDSVLLEVRPLNDQPYFETVNPAPLDGTQGTQMVIPLSQWTRNIDLDGPKSAMENIGERYAQDISHFTFNYVPGSGDPNILTGDPTTNASHGLIITPNASYGINGSVTYSVTMFDTGGKQYDIPGTGALIGTDEYSSQTTLLTITVNFNQPPVAQNHSASACEGDNVDGQLSAHDPEGDAFVYVLDSSPQGSNGELTLNQNGSFVYVPYDPNFYGEADTFQFHVRELNTMNVQNSNTATLSIEIEPENDAPSFTVGENQEVEEDTGAHEIEGWATDIIPGPANESHQTVWFKVTTDNPGLFSELPTVDASTGDLSYAVKPDVSGVAHVTVVLWDNGGTDICDGIDHSEPETFTITVGDINDPPSFGGGPDQMVCEDSGHQIVPNWAKDIFAGPNEKDQTLEFIVETDRPELFVEGSLRIDPDGTLRYTPAADANGIAGVTVTLKDNGGTENGGVDTSEAYHFNIEIIPVNDAPEYNTEYSGKTLTVTAGTGEHTIEGFATDIKPGPDNESDQTVQFEITTDNPDLFTVQPYIDTETGNLHYTLADGVDGTANVTVILRDNGGTVVSYIDAYGNEIICTGDDDSDPINFELEAKQPPAPQPVPVNPDHPVYEPEGPLEPPGPQPILRPEGIYVGGELDAGMYYPGDVGPMGELHMFPISFRSMRGPAGDAPLVDVCTLEEVLQSHLGCRFAPGIYPETRLSSVRWPDLGQDRPILDEEHDMFSRLFMREPGDEGFNADADNPARDQTFQVELGDLADMAQDVLKEPVFAQEPGVEDLNDMAPGELKQAFFANKDKALDRTMRWCLDEGEPVPWENCRENVK